jgi:hypothetical protein
VQTEALERKKVMQVIYVYGGAIIKENNGV